MQKYEETLKPYLRDLIMKVLYNQLVRDNTKNIYDDGNIEISFSLQLFLLFRKKSHDIHRQFLQISLIMLFLLTSCSGFQIVNQDNKCVKWIAIENGEWTEIRCADFYKDKFGPSYEEALKRFHSNQYKRW